MSFDPGAFCRGRWSDRFIDCIDWTWYQLPWEAKTVLVPKDYPDMKVTISDLAIATVDHPRDYVDLILREMHLAGDRAVEVTVETVVPLAEMISW